MPDNSVPPHMFLVSFKLLLKDWSFTGGSPNKSVRGPFKRNAWDSRSPPSPSATICWFVQPEVMGTFLHGSGTLAQDAWYKSGVLHSSGRTSTASISLYILNHYMRATNQPVLLLRLSASPTSLCVSSSLNP